MPSFLDRRVELELLRRVGLNRAGVQVVILGAFQEHRVVFDRVVSLVEGLIRESFTVPEFVQRVLPRLEPTIGRCTPEALEVERVREDVRFSPAREGPQSVAAARAIFVIFLWLVFEGLLVVLARALRALIEGRACPEFLGVLANHPVPLGDGWHRVAALLLDALP